MKQTIAEALREEGYQQGYQQGLQEARQEGAIQALQRSLQNMLRAKFGRVSRATKKVIQATHDRAQLDAWFLRAVTATTLDDMGIESKP